MKKEYEETQKQKIKDEEILNNIKMQQEKKKEEIRELLIQSKKDEEQLKSINELKIKIENSNMVNTHVNNENNKQFDNYNYYKKNNTERNNRKLNYDVRNNDDDDDKNYYNNYLMEIRKRNELINQKNLEMVNSKINDMNMKKNYIYDTQKIIGINNNSVYNTSNLNNDIIKKKTDNLLKYKKIKKENNIQISNILYKNYINNKIEENSKINYDSNISNSHSKFHDKKFKNESSAKYNLNTYFQLNDKKKKMKNSIEFDTIRNKYDTKTYYTNNKIYTTKSYSSQNYLYDTNNYYNNYNHLYNKKINSSQKLNYDNYNNNINNKRHPISLTPNGLYRNKNTDNSSNNYSIIRTELEDVGGNRINYQTKTKAIIKDNNIVKTFSSNNGKNNYLTQTRFYRNRIEPEELQSNYAKEKVKAINSARTFNYKMKKDKNRGKNIASFKADYNNENHKIANSFSNINSIMKNKIKNNYDQYLSNYIADNNQIYNEIINDNSQNYRKISKKLDTYKTSCLLKKGKSYSNLQNLFRINYKDNNKQKLINYLKNSNYQLNSSNISNEMNYNNEYVCDNCIRNRLFNENNNNIHFLLESKREKSYNDLLKKK